MLIDLVEISMDKSATKIILDKEILTPWWCRRNVDLGKVNCDPTTTSGASDKNRPNVWVTIFAKKIMSKGMFKYIEPEVAGGFGEHTQLDSTSHPPLVKKLHYEFSGWLGDDIIETFPCIIVTESLKKTIEVEELTGVTFDDVIVTKSQTFNDLYPNRLLPKFYQGELYKDDFFISKDYRLAISDKAYDLLRTFNINNAILENVIDPIT